MCWKRRIFAFARPRRIPSEWIRIELFEVIVLTKLKRNHVITHLRSEQASFRASLSARNETVAADIRDNGENQMARLHAAKYLDGDFEGEAAAGALGRIVQPGVVVIVRNEVNPAPGIDFDTLIEINPTNERPESHDESPY